MNSTVLFLLMKITNNYLLRWAGLMVSQSSVTDLRVNVSVKI